MERRRWQVRRLCFLARDTVTHARLDGFYSNNDLDNLVVLEAPRKENWRYFCYATRRKNKTFDLRLGSRSLAKKLNASPDDVRLVGFEDWTAMLFNEYCNEKPWFYVRRGHAATIRLGDIAAEGSVRFVHSLIR